MRIKILGCSGGIGGNLRTTSMLVDHDILIDAGTGAADLSIEQLAAIDHIFVTHSHLDHIASIALLIDTVSAMRKKPLILYSTVEILQILKDHIFNWKIWPDFSQIQVAEQFSMAYQEIVVGEPITLDGRIITAIPANHVVPAVGYLLDSGNACFLFSGDTTINSELWTYANRARNLKYLIIETAFPNKEREIAVASKHLCPSMLAEELENLTCPAEIYISHLKPGEGQLTMREIEQEAAKWQPKKLENGMIFDI